RDRQVAELVEAAEERVAPVRMLDEREDGSVQVAREPLVGFGALLRRQLVWPFIPVLERVRLTACDAAIEENDVGLLAVERLVTHPEGNWSAAGDRTQLAGRPSQRREDVLIPLVVRRAEVIPHKTLQRVFPHALLDDRALLAHLGLEDLRVEHGQRSVLRSRW